MNVGQIKSYVWSLCDDLAGSYFTTTELTRFINQEQQETQKQLVLSGNNWYLKVDQSGSTVVNQQGYTLPTDLLAINRIELVQNPGVNEAVFPLTSITLNQKDAFQNFSGMPCAYYLQKNTIQMIPAPQQVWTIRYYYTYQIADISSDSDTPDVPTEFHEYLAKRVAMQCFIKDGRDATLLLRDIQKVEDDLKARAIERAQDRMSTIVINSDDALGVYY